MVKANINFYKKIYSFYDWNIFHCKNLVFFEDIGNIGQMHEKKDIIGPSPEI